MTQSKGSLPIYMQIAELLVRDIAAGRLIDGMRLPVAAVPTRRFRLHPSGERTDLRATLRAQFRAGGD
ncbi:MAG: hypothetical protein ACK40A_14570, partial [Pannonibacter indicus]